MVTENKPETAKPENVETKLEKGIAMVPQEKKVEIVREPTAMDLWEPRTELGKRVKSGEINDISQVIEYGTRIMEPEIVDFLVSELGSEFLLIGQAKGKFGGGRRRIFKQTQKKTKAGNKPHFTAMAVVGNDNGYVGVGTGSSKETLPARQKALRMAKLNISQISRGCGAWECGCGEPHSLPFKVKGRCGSVRVELLPAPKGVGLCVDKDIKKLMKLAGIKDVWSKTYGQTKSKINFVNACKNALEKTISTRTNKDQEKQIKFG